MELHKTRKNTRISGGSPRFRVVRRVGRSRERNEALKLKAAAP